MINYRALIILVLRHLRHDALLRILLLPKALNIILLQIGQLFYDIAYFGIVIFVEVAWFCFLRRPTIIITILTLRTVYLFHTFFPSFLAFDVHQVIPVISRRRRTRHHDICLRQNIVHATDLIVWGCCSASYLGGQAV